MIEFCPGGAVDATMLGRPPPLSFCSLCVFYKCSTFLPVTRVEFYACGSAATALHFPSLPLRVTLRRCRDKMPKMWFVLRLRSIHWRITARLKLENPHLSQYCWFALNCDFICLALNALDIVESSTVGNPLVCFYLVIHILITVCTPTAANQTQT